jgi:beta-galactosidase GanA
MALVLNGSGVITGVTDLATAGVTLDDAALTDPVITGGVYLGGTGSANYLDDYEEGTWTATMSSGSVTADRTTYTKVGRLVTVQARLTDITDYTSADNVVVQGLPFAVSATSGSHMGAMMCRYINVGRSSIVAQSGASTTTFAFVGYDSDNSIGWSTLEYRDATAPWDVQVSLTYETDS